LGLPARECRQVTHGGLAAWLAIPRLSRRREVQQSTAGRITLTERGRQLAQTLIRAHRLWEAYLVEHFDLPLDHLHESASRVEHYIDPGLQEELSEALNRPQLDPHGKPIPSGPG
jgi:Mn-dependent DtxR family transcriptional regulator